MNTRNVYRSCALLFAVSAAACGDSPTVVEDVDVSERTVDVLGVTRSYRLYQPPSVSPAEASPLVLVYPGATQSAAGAELMTWMYPSAGDHRVRVAYLQAAGDYWSTPASPPGYWGVNDVGFTIGVIDQLVAEGLVDPSRVYATGFSNGAVFVERLACVLADRIAGVAVVGASMSRDLAEACVFSRGIPSLFFLGDADTQFFWDDGFAANARQYGGQASADWWAKANRCDPTPSIVELPDPVDDGTSVERWDFAGCRDGVDFQFYRIRGGGHTWPGSPLGGGGPLGRQTQDIDASALMVDFFLRWTLPGAGT